MQCLFAFVMWLIHTFVTSPTNWQCCSLLQTSSDYEICNAADLAIRNKATKLAVLRFRLKVQTGCDWEKLEAKFQSVYVRL